MLVLLHQTFLRVDYLTGSWSDTLQAIWPVKTKNRSRP